MSAKITPIMFSVGVLGGVWARVCVNGLPIFKGRYIGPSSRSGDLNPYLKNGENELTIELRMIKHPEGHRLEDAVRVQLYEVLNMDAPENEVLKTRDVVLAQYPQILDASEREHKELPFFYRTTFDPGIEGLPDPPYLDAPTAEFGCEGTPELRDAVARFVGALASGDHDDFLDQMKLKFTHGERSMRGFEEKTAAHKRRVFHEYFLQFGPKPAPLDMGELHFEPLHDGKVAFVTRHDGGYAVSASCERSNEHAMETDLLLTRVGRGWSIFL